MALLWAIYALNGNQRAWLTGPLQAAIVSEFKIGSTQMGLLTGLLIVGQGILAIPLTTWVDRAGRGWARKRRYVYIVAGYVLFSLLTGLPWLTSSIVGLFVIQFVQKLFSGPGESVEVSMAVEWWPHERVGFAQGLHHTGYPWGTFIGSLIISLILTVFGPTSWRLVFLTLPLISIPLVIAYWHFSSRENYQEFVDDTISRGMTPPLGNDTEHLEKKARPGAVRESLGNPNVVAGAIVAGLGQALYYGMNFLVPLYLVFVGNYTIAAVASLSAVFMITAGVGQILWGSISDKIGRKLSIVLMCLWMAVGIVLMQFIGKGVWALVSAELFIGLATNGIYPVLYSFSSESSAPDAIGISNGINMTGQMLGIVGPVMAGAMVSLGGGYSSGTGYLIGFYVLGAMMVCAALIVLLFTRETVGWWKKHDRALTSRERCLRGVAQ